VEFRILGPLEVLENSRPLALGRLKERIVLAVLLLHANEIVSRERLIDELWGTSPPATARKAVNVYISKLRQTLTRNGHDPIATAEGGYRLGVDPDLLDAERLRSLIAQARSCIADGDSDPASQLLQEAVGARAVWTTGGLGGGNNRAADGVTKIDPRTDRIIRTIPLGDRTRVTCGIAATPSAVWVTIGNTACDTIGQ